MPCLQTSSSVLRGPGGELLIMQITELIKEIKDVQFEEIRKDSPIYFEAVLTKSKLTQLNAILIKAFGKTAWPSTDKLTPEIQKTILSFGGIQQGQTLYFNQEGTTSCFAMLWPWQNGELITLKTGQK